MSKLFDLKEWLTVTDTARHLSIVFGEDVSKADVLRLALDGHLQLSVDFLNGAYARSGKVAYYSDTELLAAIESGTLPDDLKWATIPAELVAKIRPNSIPSEAVGKPMSYLISSPIDNDRYLTLSDEVTTIEGVWDLPMIGAERLDIEHLYQQITGGPAVTLQGLDGAFVENRDGDIYQLQESFDNNEHQSGSTAELHKLNQHIAENKIKHDDAESLLDNHKENRKNYLEKRKSRPAADDYYPAGCLPEDSVLVVKTDSLRQFEQSLSHGGKTQKYDDLLSESERNSLLKLAFGMAISAYKYDPRKNRNSASGENRGSIAADLSRIGLNIDTDTIRKYIKEAEERFSDVIIFPENP